jgi:nucleotide-binding universal stress UspA family protein
VRAEPGSAVHLLVTCSRTADLVVVGRSERAGLDQLVLGPVSCPTAAMARGPVAVVPLRARPGRPRRLVAYVDPEHDPTTVLDFAFDEARAAERPVRIVHALEPARSAEALSAQLTGSGASRRPTSQELAELLEVWSTKYTDVDRTITVRRGPAAAALLQEVADDDLVVLGGRRHPRVVGRLLGSVPDAVLRQAPCTAVVVHSRDER